MLFTSCFKRVCIQGIKLMFFRPIHILPIVFLASLFGAVVVVKAHRAAPQEARTGAQAFAPSTDREVWAVALLGRLGNAEPTAETVAMIVEWTLAEDGSDGALRRNNPLNTTKCGFNQT